MFGDFVRLIYCFSTPCKNDLPCCSTCIMQSLREDVQSINSCFVTSSVMTFPSSYPRKSRLTISRFRQSFVLQVPKHTKLEIMFRGGHHKRPADLFFRGHYDDMLSKRIVDSVRKLFLSFDCGSSERDDSDRRTSRRCGLDGKS